MTSRARLSLLAALVAAAALVLSSCGSDDDTTAVDPGTSAESPGDTPTPEQMQFDEYPAMEIDEAKSYTATVELAKGGSFVIELYPKQAPLAVNSFATAARCNFIFALPTPIAP